MPTLNYKRCWSREQIRNARAFILDHAVSLADNVPGFCDQPTRAETETLLSVPEMIYTFALDGDAIVAVHAVKQREQGRWTVVIYTADPAYDHLPLFWNMMQLLASDVMTEGDEWRTTITAGPAVEHLLQMPWTDGADEPQEDDRGVLMQTVFGTVGTPRPMVEVARV